MSPLKRGTIIDVNLDPTKGSETGRIRPCIIVTNDTYNERVPVVQVVPVTAWSVKAGDYFDVLPERGRPRYILVSDFQTFELQPRHWASIIGKSCPNGWAMRQSRYKS